MSGQLRVPFVPTPEPVVRRMLTLANVKAGETIYDLGAGDGRILSSAVRDFGAKAVGVELHASRYASIAERIRRERLGDYVRLIRADFLDVNLSGADVVTLYLLPSVNTLMKRKLEVELRPGARVVSHDFPIHGWVASYAEKIRDPYGTHMIYLYEVPGSWQRRLRRLAQPIQVSHFTNRRSQPLSEASSRDTLMLA